MKNMYRAFRIFALRDADDDCRLEHAGRVLPSQNNVLPPFSERVGRGAG